MVACCDKIVAFLNSDFFKPLVAQNAGGHLGRDFLLCGKGVRIEANGVVRDF